MIALSRGMNKWPKGREMNVTITVILPPNVSTLGSLELTGSPNADSQTIIKGLHGLGGLVPGVYVLLRPYRKLRDGDVVQVFAVDRRFAGIRQVKFDFVVV